jgi:hypothetical protein
MKFLSFILFFGVVFSGGFALAVENEEIEYLLSHIATSDCVFIRNGKEHQPQKASEHLAMKYSHVKKRIKTADDFIDKIASQSSITRRQYKIGCDGVQIPARQWLRQALESFRISAENQEIVRE